jgi:hypothetical protein
MLSACHIGQLDWVLLRIRWFVGGHGFERDCLHGIPERWRSYDGKRQQRDHLRLDG